MTNVEHAPAAALAETLRAATLTGELYPGQRLVEQDLAVRYETSRGAVREALLVLESEGLVERQANRGAHIRLVSLEEAIEMTEVREVLEGLCAAKAVAAIDDAGRAELRALGEGIRDAVETADVIEYTTVTQLLHARIIEMSGQTVAQRTLDRLRYQGVRHRFRVALLSGRPAEGLQEHLAVIEAICTGTAEEAEKAMREHLSCVKDALLRAPATADRM
jgi:DNA-binding GntR family transcriptional regulator